MKNGFIINFLCSDFGGFDRHRNLIFKRWYKNFEGKELFDKFDYELEDSGSGKRTYLGFIIKKNNELYNEFCSSVDGEIELYQDDK